jgi:hypothetical protein
MSFRNIWAMEEYIDVNIEIKKFFMTLFGGDG